MMWLTRRRRKFALDEGGHAEYLSRVPRRVLSFLLLALLAWIPLGRGQAWTSRGNVRDRALFAVSALDLAASPARASSGTRARAELVPSPTPATPPLAVPVVDAERVWAHVQRTWWPAAADR